MSKSQKLRILEVLIVAVVVTKWMWLLHQTHGNLDFDDAFMFDRYARHFRAGLGLSWNLDGVHSYGMTSLLWMGVILLFSFMPLSPARMLVLASMLMFAGAMVALALGVARNAKTEYFRRPALLLAPIALLYFVADVFRLNAVNGMETMLGCALMAAFAGVFLAQLRGAVRPEVTGSVAVLLLLTRPESALAVGMAVLTAVAVKRLSLGNAARVLGCLLLGAALALLFGRLYFGSPLPLSFFLKSRNYYVGYSGRWYPVELLSVAVRAVLVPVLTTLLFVRRQALGTVAIFWVPFLAVSCYLLTITQIMGNPARYFEPYLPLLILPAFLVIDDRLNATGRLWPVGSLLPRFALAALLLGYLYLLPVRVTDRLELLAERHVLAYDDVSLHIAATHPLPEIKYIDAIRAVSGTLLQGLPKGTTAAASEIGYLGSAQPDLNIIDLAGLNDPDIAMHGVAPERLLSRHPDVIWLPHWDYTYQRGLLLTDPRLLREYDVYARSLDFGLAIRKAGPCYARLTNQLAAVWARYYPGTRPHDYMVQSVDWDRGTYVPAVQH